MLSLLVLVLTQNPADMPPPLHTRAARAAFEAFPTDGAGAGTECACVAATGARGESMVYTRASPANCTKGTPGVRTTGIANGDLVTCITDQLRVMRDNDGVLGPLVESSRQNSCQRSEEFDNPLWVPYRDGLPSVPTVTANAAVAPDGTTTADRVDFNATSAALNQSSIIYQAGVLTAAAWAGSVYVKGVSGSGTIDICLGTTSCGQCAYVSTSWTRCTRSATASGTLSYFFGNGSFYSGQGRPAQSVYLWGAQAETSTHATSYVRTTNIAATRAVDDRPHFPVAAFNPRCVSASITPLWASADTNRRAVRTDFNGGDSSRFELYVSGANLSAFANDGTASQTIVQAVSGLPATARLAGLLIPAVTISAVANGTSSIAGTAVTAPSVNRIYVGAYAGATGFEANGIVSRIKVDTTTTGCQ